MFPERLLDAISCGDLSLVTATLLQSINDMDDLSEGTSLRPGKLGKRAIEITR